MTTYAAVIASRNGRYRVAFPDFADLGAEGDTVEQARTNAKNTLEDHLATVSIDDLPAEPKSLDTVLTEATGTAIVVELAVSPPKSPAVRINITIAEDLLAAVDRAAEAHSMSRSRFLANAVEAVVTGRRHNGIQIPLGDETLAAVDRAAEAHQMNRIPFLASLIRSTVTRTAHTSPSRHG
jgi:predicted RNase H-like HicB family nuclease/predicted DNA binding CopG/RHH family protein